MYKKVVLALIFVCSVILSVKAQAQKYNLSGTIKDSSNGETLIGVSLYVEEIKSGVTSNEYGFFSIKLSKGTYTIVVSTSGYKKYKRIIELTADVRLNIDLADEVINEQEVVVTGERQDKNVEDTKMSNIRLDMKQVKKLPALFGEIDIIKNIQMLPGISVAGEGNTGLYVRGGGADQNLILIDEAPVYNPSHLFGMFSIFNSEAIKSAEIYKGGIPAQYGDRLSSLLDIRTKDGNAKKIGVSGGIGLIASRLTIQGPLIKDKCTFIVSARRTYADLLLKLAESAKVINNPNIKGVQLYFYDLNGKVNYKLNKNNQIFLAGYYGKDVLSAAGFGLNWSNATSTLRWNHVFGSRLFSNTTLLYSDYNYELGITSGSNGFKWKSGLQEIGIKQDFTYFLNPKNEVSFGASISYKSYNPGKFTPDESNTTFKKFNLEPYHSLEEAVYISNKQKFTKRFSAEYGLRYTLFQNIGKDSVAQYNGAIDPDNLVGEKYYKPFQLIKGFGGLAPRMSARYLLNDRSSIKASYNRTYQFMHLLSNSASPLPTSQWIPSTPYIKPQKADQVALGYFRNFKENKYEASAETFYKYYYNTIDFKDNANIIANKNIETEVRRGTGWAYGLELFLRKNTGKLTGWISYTWSKTQLKIPGINNGNAYYASWDRRNNFNIVMSYDISPRWNISANWVYGSGRPLTLPIQLYQYGQSTVGYMPGRNNFRIPAYDRMDISATIYAKKKEGRKNFGSWNFSIYNVYARKNAFTVFVRDKNVGTADHPIYDGEKEVVKLYLFTIIPSVTYNFNF
jgi:outer membrane cobalamin receptor